MFTPQNGQPMIKYFEPRLDATGWLGEPTGEKVQLYVDSVKYTFEPWGNGEVMPHIEAIEASTFPGGDLSYVTLDIKSVNQVFKLLETPEV
jgi:hypothetical protein